MEPQKPQIPSLKDSQKKPEMKIKGLAAGGLSLIERLKSFKKKDLAFIGAGLMVLFLAPLAEHFLMAPDQPASGSFKQGWDFKSGQFGSGASPYEPGVHGLAQGNLLGGSAEVITPLNVRDPSALIMGPGQSQQQAVTAPPPPPAPSKATPPDWKDALAAAAGRAGKEATKAASLPVPKAPLQGALRGLGATGGGGSGASFSNAPITAAGSSKPAQSGALTNVKSATGFKGAATSRGNAPNSGSLEQLKKAAGQAAGEMNRGGGAAGNLLNSNEASQAIPGGAGGGGASGTADGSADKAGSQNQDKGSKQQGEGLEFMIAKENAMRDLDMKWDRKKKEADMKWKKDNFKDDMMLKAGEKLVMDGFIAPITGAIAKGIEGMFDRGASAIWVCSYDDTGTPFGDGPRRYEGAARKCGGGGAAKEKSVNRYVGPCVGPGLAGKGKCLFSEESCNSKSIVAAGCNNVGGGGASEGTGGGDGGKEKPTGVVPPEPDPGQTVKPGPDGKPVIEGRGLYDVCKTINGSTEDYAKDPVKDGTPNKDKIEQVRGAVAKMREVAVAAVKANNGLRKSPGAAGSDPCGPGNFPAGQFSFGDVPAADQNLRGLQKEIKKQVGAAAAAMKSTVEKGQAIVTGARDGAAPAADGGGGASGIKGNGGDAIATALDCKAACKDADLAKVVGQVQDERIFDTVYAKANSLLAEFNAELGKVPAPLGKVSAGQWPPGANETWAPATWEAGSLSKTHEDLRKAIASEVGWLDTDLITKKLAQVDVAALKKEAEAYLADLDRAIVDVKKRQEFHANLWTRELQPELKTLNSAAVKTKDVHSHVNRTVNGEEGRRTQNCPEGACWALSGFKEEVKKKGEEIEVPLVDGTKADMSKGLAGRRVPMDAAKKKDVLITVPPAPPTSVAPNGTKWGEWGTKYIEEARGAFLEHQKKATTPLEDISMEVVPALNEIKGINDRLPTIKPEIPD